MSGSRTCYTRHLVPAGAGVRSVPTKYSIVLFPVLPKANNRNISKNKKSTNPRFNNNKAILQASHW